MSATPQDPEGIRTLNELVDYTISEANKHIDHDRDQFMHRLHARILRSLRNDNDSVEDRVLKAYFRMYALLNNRTVSRTRLIATIEAVSTWLRN